ncbi:MAG: GAF domain-containing protein [Pseudomonadales bacterium]|nr:GAF domain-containing protein [Pseudomonadales bacterium]
MAKSPKIALLETDYISQQNLASALRSAGWEVVLVTDSTFTMFAVGKAKPDIIVLSHRLKEQPFDALHKLQNNAQTASIPIIGISDNEEQSTKFLAGGACQCLITPLGPGRVIEAIKEQVQKFAAPTLAPSQTIRESERLQALRNADLLDKPAEPSFDRITELAAKLLDVPTALMSLVDEDRQFFKAQVGLGEPWSSQRETPLTHSFCQWVVSDRDNLVVFNAKEHPVLRNNDAITDLGVTAYAGVPITAEPNQAIGSFCVIDSKPKEWNEDDIAILEDLTEIINAYISIKQAQQEPENPIKNLKQLAAISKVISGATRIISRVGDRLQAEEELQLKTIIEQQRKHLVSLSMV